MLEKKVARVAMLAYLSLRYICSDSKSAIPIDYRLE